ncbi:MAG TPA: hydrogenase, partial [Candidatus Glassbacteria bacterium]|nr:hydrogenase [Candidatus Glassbacteria bacterium]
LLAYLAMRLGDLAVKGNLALAFDGSTAGALFLIEVVGLAVVPMILLALPGIRRSAGRIFAVQLLVVGGVILNRFNVNFLTQSRAGSSYFPSWMEIVITVGLIAAIMMLYRVAVIRLPIFSQAEKDR